MYAIRSYYARNSGVLSVWPRTQVPPAAGSLLEPTNTGMPLRSAGCRVAGCSTLAPKVARITSYNVCYTKLLRLQHVADGGAGGGGDDANLARMPGQGPLALLGKQPLGLQALLELLQLQLQLPRNNFV